MTLLKNNLNFNFTNPLRYHIIVLLSFTQAPVAQLDRVVVSEAIGRGFKSLQVRSIRLYSI